MRLTGRGRVTRGDGAELLTSVAFTCDMLQDTRSGLRDVKGQLRVDVATGNRLVMSDGLRLHIDGGRVLGIIVVNSLGDFEGTGFDQRP